MSEDAPEDDHFPDVGRPPENEIPATVAFEAQLVSAGDLALFVAGLHVYSIGIEMRLELRSRAPQQDLFDAFHRQRSDGLLVGVEFADGRRGSNAGWGGGLGAEGDRVAGGVLVIPGGGGGSDRAVDADFFIAPLPPPGPLRVVCAWPRHNITDQVTELPTAEILAAATRVTELWPPQPRNLEPRIPEPPAVSSDSWFAG